MLGSISVKEIVTCIRLNFPNAWL